MGLVYKGRQKTKWFIFEFAEKPPSYFCPNEIDESGYFRCDFINKFIFNTKNMRYQKYLPFGFEYVDFGNPDEPDDMPAIEIEIGTCSEL